MNALRLVRLAVVLMAVAPVAVAVGGEWDSVYRATLAEVKSGLH